MKKTFVAAIILMMSLVLLSSALANEAPAVPVSGSCGENVTWTLDTDTGTLTISGSGAMQDFSDAYDQPWADSRESIQAVVIENGVTSIGNNAFCDCYNLLSATIPSSVTSIGNDAFCYCDSLTSISIPNSVTSIGSNAFCYCGNLTSIYIPNSVTSIGAFAIYGCSSLTDIQVDSDNAYFSSADGVLFNKNKTTLLSFPAGKTGEYSIPYGVESISASAFYLCTGLVSVVIPDSVTFIANWVFSNCRGLRSVTIPSSVTYIIDGTFEVCPSLSDVYYRGTEEQWNAVTIEGNNDALVNAAIHCTGNPTEGLCGDNVTWTMDVDTGVLTIRGNGAMRDLYSNTQPWRAYRVIIQTVVIKNGVTRIGNNAFIMCHALTNLTIPSSVTSIGNYAFGSCRGLTSVTIPNSVTSIGEYVFTDCSNLTGIHVDSDNADYMDENGVLFNKSKTTLIAYPAGLAGEYTIPSSVTSIGNYAFYWCGGLSSVTILNSVASIGNDAFQHCYRLKSVTIPSSVTSIGDWAFTDCYSLSDVYYGGTALQWSAIAIGYNNDALINATIHYPGGGIGSTCGENVTWSLDTDSGVLTIIGSGPMTDYGWDDQPWHDYQRIIQTVVIENGVTTIGDNAFYCYDALANVTIPNSVTSIGNYAFETCMALTNVTIPGGVTSIGESAFGSCHGLTSVTIPSSVTSIGDQAFNECINLTGIHVDSGNAYYTDENGVLFNISKTALINYPAGLTGEYTIPSSVASISNRAFCWCIGLTSVTIPSSVTSIGNYAFGSCRGLTSVTIPNSVTSIGEYVFTDCSNLTGIHVDSDNADYMDENGVLFNKSKTTLIAYPAGLAGEYTIPSGVTNIGVSAFESCNNLTSVTIPNSVTSIGNNAFYYCNALTSVTIPASVTSIEYYAFAWCRNLTDVYYSGTAEQWCAIAIDYGNDALTNAAIHYTENGSVMEGTCGDNVTWSLYTGTGVLTISGSGPMTDYDWNNQPWRDYKESIIRTVIIESGVTSIGSYAFYGCDFLTSITIPNSVTSIGNSAFRSCNSLKRVTIPNSVTSIGNYAFNCCSGLTSVTIPSSVTSIGNSAFNDCDSLTSVTIPNSVTSIGAMAFGYCHNLTGIHVDSGNADYADINGVLFNKSITTLIAYPAGLAGEYSMPAGVTTISRSAFEGCYDLTGVIIPSSVTSINDYAFLSCSNLTSVTIPSSVTSIGERVFNYCSNLTGIHVNSDNAYYSDENGVLLNKSKTTLIAYPAGLAGEYTIPDSVTKIGDSAFEGRYNLTSVTIPNSVTSIGNSAFSCCSGLASVTIPNSVTSIEGWAFRGCPGLMSVTIPSSVTSIGDWAFTDCNNLTDVYYGGTAEQWSAVTIGYRNDALINANIHYGSQIPDLSELNVLYLPASLQSIEDEAFMDLPCQAVIIPDGCSSIGNRAFKGCFNLVYVRIPASVTTIADDAFDGCSDGLFIDRRTE